MLPKYIRNSDFRPVLDTKCIDIWQFSLKSITEEAQSLLNEEEKNRANRFHFERHQRRFAAARSKLRQILASYLVPEINIDEKARDLQFSYNDYGKPQLISDSGLEFNLSHSGDLALLAVGKDFPVGIDLEFFSDRPLQGIAKNLFSEQELEVFLKLPDFYQPQAFFHVWAQKEAFIKACGMGLSYPTQRFSVPVLPPTGAEIEDPLHQTHWKMTSFMPLPACAAAVCYHPLIERINFVRLP